ncbi:hypothetical protein HF295_06690 [Hujiaoplasma nucleasis]|uniref:Uncharacterized protein n=1 Tax=Hujiaoplasma nucleasis TaxID=2725268 RepID=A0A7L6N2R0_9MOLU|nr:hypothetical protein [Hujiaoplasma nucleasis]QLY40550.1 hypothetical protein HF295_06690 [Hujiaoplasma nucleasis]
MIYEQFVNFVDYVLVWLSNREELNKNKILDIRDHIIYGEPGVSLHIAMFFFKKNKIMISKGDYQVFKKYIEDMTDLKKKYEDYFDKFVDDSNEEKQIFKHEKFNSIKRSYGIFEDLIKKEDILCGHSLFSYKVYNQYICDADKLYYIYAILKTDKTRYYLVKVKHILIFLPSETFEMKDDILPEQWIETKVTIHSNKYKLIGYKPFVDDFRIINRTNSSFSDINLDRYKRRNIKELDTDYYNLIHFIK